MIWIPPSVHPAPFIEPDYWTWVRGFCAVQRASNAPRAALLMRGRPEFRLLAWWLATGLNQPVDRIAMWMGSTPSAIQQTIRSMHHSNSPSIDAVFQATQIMVNHAPPVPSSHRAVGMVALWMSMHTAQHPLDLFGFSAITRDANRWAVAWWMHRVAGLSRDQVARRLCLTPSLAHRWVTAMECLGFIHRNAERWMQSFRGTNRAAAGE